MFGDDADKPDTLRLGGGKRRKSSRRSSILKVSKSPTRGALSDLDPNTLQDDDTTNTLSVGTKMKRRLSRRVSFAETYHVKEFIKDSDSGWTNPEASGAAAQHEPEPPAPPPEEHTDTAPLLSGLETLLTGAIQNECAIGYSDHEVMTNERSPVQEVPMPNDSYDSEAQRLIAQNATMNNTCNMEMTRCYGDISLTTSGPPPGSYNHHDAEENGVRSSSSSSTEQIDAKSFLSRLMSKSNDSGQVLRSNLNTDSYGSSEVKIDSKSFLNRIMSNKSDHKDVKIDTQSFLQSLSKKSNKESADSSFENPEKTHIFGNEATGMMDFTQCQADGMIECQQKVDAQSFLQSLSEKRRKKDEGLIVGNPDKTCLFGDENKGEMDLTECQSPYANQCQSENDQIDASKFLGRLMSKSTVSATKHSRNPFGDDEGDVFSPEAKIDSKAFLTRLMSNPKPNPTDEVDPVNSGASQTNEVQRTAKEEPQRAGTTCTKSFPQTVGIPASTPFSDENLGCATKKVKLFSSLLEDEDDQPGDVRPTSVDCSQSGSLKNSRGILRDITCQYEHNGPGASSDLGSSDPGTNNRGDESSKSGEKTMLEKTVNFQLAECGADDRMEMTQCIGSVSISAPLAGTYHGVKTTNINVQNNVDITESMDFTACLGGIHVNHVVGHQLAVLQNKSKDSQDAICVQGMVSKTITTPVDALTRLGVSEGRQNLEDAKIEDKPLLLQSRGVKRKSFDDDDSLNITRCLGNISIVSQGNLDTTMAANSMARPYTPSDPTRSIFCEQPGDMDLTAYSGPADRTEDLQCRIAEIIGLAADDAVQEGNDIAPMESMAKSLSGFVSDLSHKESPLMPAVLHVGNFSENATGTDKVDLGLHTTSKSEPILSEGQSKFMVGDLNKHSVQGENNLSDNINPIHKTSHFEVEKTSGVDLSGLEIDKNENQKCQTSAGNKTQLFDKTSAMEMTTCLGEIKTNGDIKQDSGKTDTIELTKFVGGVVADEKRSNETAFGEKTCFFGLDKTGAMEMTMCGGQIEGAEVEDIGHSNRTVLGEKTCFFGSNKTSAMEMTTCVGRIEDADSEEGKKQSNTTMFGEKTYLFGLDKTGSMDMTCAGGVYQEEDDEGVHQGVCENEPGLTEPNNLKIIPQQFPSKQGNKTLVGERTCLFGSGENAGMEITTCVGGFEDEDHTMIKEIGQKQDAEDLQPGTEFGARLNHLRAKLGTLENSRVDYPEGSAGMDVTSCNDDGLNAQDCNETNVFGGNTTTNLNSSACLSKILGSATFKRRRSVLDKTRIFNSDPTAAMDITTCVGGMLADKTLMQSSSALEKTKIYQNNPMADMDFTRCTGGIVVDTPASDAGVAYSKHTVTKPISTSQCPPYSEDGPTYELTDIVSSSDPKTDLAKNEFNGPVLNVRLHRDSQGSTRLSSDNLCLEPMTAGGTLENIAQVEEELPARILPGANSLNEVDSKKASDHDQGISGLDKRHNSITSSGSDPTDIMEVSLELVGSVLEVDESAVAKALQMSEITQDDEKTTPSSECNLDVEPDIVTGESDQIKEHAATEEIQGKLSDTCQAKVPVVYSLPTRPTGQSEQSYLEQRWTTNSKMYRRGNNSSLGSSSCLEPRLTLGQSMSSMCGEELLQVVPLNGQPKTVDDYLKLIDPVFFMPPLPSRRSTMKPMSIVAEQSMKGNLELAAIVDPQLQVYDWACKKMTEHIQSLDDVSRDLEDKLMSDPPQLFKDIAAMKNTHALKSKFMKEIAEPCRKRAKREFKDWRKKIVDTITETIKEEEAEIDEGIDKMVERLEAYEDSSAKLKKVDAVLDNYLYMKKMKARTGSKSGFSSKTVAVKEEIKDLRAELKRKKKDKREKAQKLSALIRKESQMQREVLEIEHQIFQAEKIRSLSEETHNVLQDIDNLNQFLEWHLEYDDVDGAEFTFLHKTLALHVDFGAELDVPAVSGKKPRHIVQFALESKLADESAPYSHLAHQLVLGAVDTCGFLKQFPDTRSLPKMLQEVSSKVHPARCLADDICHAELTHDVTIKYDEPFCVDVKFSSLKAFAKFSLIVHVPSIVDTNTRFSWDFASEIGNVRIDDIESILKHFEPSVINFGRVIKEIDRFLENRCKKS